jgi:hypothetical protein
MILGFLAGWQENQHAKKCKNKVKLWKALFRQFNQIQAAAGGSVLAFVIKRRQPAGGQRAGLML